MGDIQDTVRASLESHGLTVVAIDFPQNVFHDEPGYVRELKKALAACTPRMVMPIGSTLALARNRDVVPEGTVVPVAAAHTIAALESKVEASRIATASGVPQPKMYASAEAVEAFPAIFKRDRSFGGSGVYRPKTREALQKLMVHEAGGKFLIEELVLGTDYSVDVLRLGEKIRFSCYRSLSKAQGQGPSSEREIVDLPILGEYASKILSAANYQGICGLDFIVTPDGKAFFLECNPRFCGGISTQIASGFDLPWLLWQHYFPTDK